MGEVTLNHYLYLSAILFFIGAFGVLFRRNLLVILMSIELMLNAVNLSFVAFARNAAGSMDGHVIAFFVMALAAAEAGIGLAILVMLFRNRTTVQADDLTLMRD
ncbi:MAG TPA: NADH-quinone oxidoreductase subunit NuoK [Candidatus Krumholzibacteria bacterium]|nr:NADH-quinone oxidoreductase subunit NuoK [Candidatus Krumholzibacteria bacterium]